MLKFARKWFQRFRSQEDGYVTIEVVMLLPPLLITMSACWVLFDVFRQQAVNQKANYTIGDMISRETEAITPNFVDGTRNLLRELTRSDDANARLRISVVSYNARNDRYSVEWSEERGGVGTLNNGTLRGEYLDRLPIMANAEQVVLVETWDEYTPVFRIGLDGFDITTYSFTRPRYAPQITWSRENQNNGWGNGDQDAPGNSLCNNNAENQTNCS